MKLRENPIDFVNSMLCLGIILDGKLNFDLHIDNITHINCVLHYANYTIRTCDHLFKLNIPSPLIPHVNYCIDIIFDRSSYNLNRLTLIFICKTFFLSFAFLEIFFHKVSKNLFQPSNFLNRTRTVF